MEQFLVPLSELKLFKELISKVILRVLLIRTMSYKLVRQRQGKERGTFYFLVSRETVSGIIWRRVAAGALLTFLSPPLFPLPPE